MNVKFTYDDLKIYIWPIAGILITLILLISVIIPQIFSIMKTNAEIEQQKALSQGLQNKSEILENINLNKFKADFNSLSVALPSSPDIPSAISQIQVLAANSNVTIKSFSISMPSSSTSDNFQLRVDLEGELDDINKFIVDLKTSSRLLVLNKVELAGSKNSSTYQASLALTAYFQTVETTLSAIDKEIQPLNQDDLEEIVDISRNVKANQGVSEITTTGPKGKANPFQ